MRQSDEAALLSAHAAGDEEALVRYYAAEADRREVLGDIDAACFYLTQAYVHALHAGLAEAPGLHSRLIAYGREE